MNKRTLFLFAMTLPGALAATGCDRFFSYEQGKANKVVEYFNKLGPIYSQEMWPGGIGPNIGKLPAPRKKISPLETLGHTLECDLS